MVIIHGIETMFVLGVGIEKNCGYRILERDGE